MEKIECCKELRQAVEQEEIYSAFGFLYVYGEPNVIDDGGDEPDDMTTKIRISYCPFCGAKLSA